MRSRPPSPKLGLLREIQSHFYGGELRKKAAFRKARPLTHRQGSIHLTMRSSQARGGFSFLTIKNQKRTADFVSSFSKKRGIQILKFENAGNHLHFRIRVANRNLYKAWIRGLSAGLALIAMSQQELMKLKSQKKSFWDYRPFTRILSETRSRIPMQNTKGMTWLIAQGYSQDFAELMVLGSQKFLSSG